MARLDVRCDRLFQRVAQRHSPAKAVQQGQGFHHRTLSSSAPSLSVQSSQMDVFRSQTQAITLTLLFRSVGAVSASPSHVSSVAVHVLFFFFYLLRPSAATNSSQRAFEESSPKDPPPSHQLLTLFCPNRSSSVFRLI